MLEKKFIKVHSAVKGFVGSEIIISIDGIFSISFSDLENCTVIGHAGHNNCGFKVTEKTEEILELIKNQYKP